MKKSITEIRGEDSTELKARLNDLRKEQFQLRFRGGDDATKTTRPREVRRTIARIMTVLGERDRGQVVAARPAGARQTGAKQTDTKQAGTKKTAAKKTGGKQ